jgi:hypothetical protein
LELRNTELEAGNMETGNDYTERGVSSSNILRITGIQAAREKSGKKLLAQRRKGVDAKAQSAAAFQRFLCAFARKKLFAREALYINSNLNQYLLFSGALI